MKRMMIIAMSILMMAATATAKNLRVVEIHTSSNYHYADYTQRVSRSLNKLRGIDRVVINPTEKTIVVTYDRNRVYSSDIVNQLNRDIRNIKAHVKVNSGCYTSCKHCYPMPMHKPAPMHDYHHPSGPTAHKGNPQPSKVVVTKPATQPAVAKPAPKPDAKTQATQPARTSNASRGTGEPRSSVGR